MKVFLASVPSCHGTSLEAIQTWYMLFTKMAATTGIYRHPYFCFRKHADSNNGFTCGFDTAPITHVPAVPEIFHQPEVLTVVTIIYVPANALTEQAEVLGVTSSVLVPEFLA